MILNKISKIPNFYSCISKIQVNIFVLHKGIAKYSWYACLTHPHCTSNIPKPKPKPIIAKTYNTQKGNSSRLENVLMYEIEDKLKLSLEAYYFSEQDWVMAHTESHIGLPASWVKSYGRSFPSLSTLKTLQTQGKQSLVPFYRNNQ